MDEITWEEYLEIRNAYEIDKQARREREIYLIWLQGITLRWAMHGKDFPNSFDKYKESFGGETLEEQARQLASKKGIRGPT